MRASAQPCPNGADHTPAPAGYLAWHEWAETMSATHQQQRCPGCGLLAIWEPLGEPTAPTPPAERGCRSVRTMTVL